MPKLMSQSFKWHEQKNRGEEANQEIQRDDPSGQRHRAGSTRQVPLSTPLSHNQLFVQSSGDWRDSLSGLALLRLDVLGWPVAATA
jgi:hypothetical protein